MSTSLKTIDTNDPEIMVGGYLFSNKPKYDHFVIPVGLQQPISFLPMNENAKEGEHHTLIDSAKFDALFYSVGKDLGKSRLKITKNKTHKNKI